MKTIEVDNELYEFLKKKAEPFVDTPNTVLRKLLFGEDGNSVPSITLEPLPPSAPTIGLQTHQTTAKRTRETSSEAFDRICWQERFSGQPRKVSPYKVMWESASDIVYFQNFNKAGSPNLWYRLSRSALETMRSQNKHAWICFTNPADNFGYSIPLTEVDKKADSYGWTRDDIEVNIDVGNDRWREFDWILTQFKFVIKNT